MSSFGNQHLGNTLGPKSNKAVFYMFISFVSLLFSFSLQFVSSNHVSSISKFSLRLRVACFSSLYCILFDYDVTNLTQAMRDPFFLSF